MDWGSWRVCLAPGDAVISREGTTLVLAVPTDPVHEQFLDELLRLCTASVIESPDATREALVRSVGALVTQAPPGSVPGFGLITTAGDGLVVMLVGDTGLSISADDGSVEELHGRDSTTFLDRRVRADFRELSLFGSVAAVPDLRSNLSGGVVRGDGLLVRRGPAPLTPAPVQPSAPIPAPAPAPAPAPFEETVVGLPPVSPPPPETAPSASFVSISLHEPDPGENEPGENERVYSADPSVHDLASTPGAVPTVQGIVCSRGHFNDPSAIFCAGCGISMVHQTHNLVAGIRPPLGVVVIDDGSAFTLSCDYVLGREPENAEDVLSGAAIPLSLGDPDLVMSRVHARILLDGWEVRVEDAHSANGTFIAPHEEDAWTRLPPGMPTTIAPGTRVSLGGRTFIFESHQKTIRGTAAAGPSPAR